MFDMLHCPLVIQSISKRQILGMVRDRHIFIPVLSGGLGHFLNAVPAVGFHRVHVHIALQILLRNQIGQ